MLRATMGAAMALLAVSPALAGDVGFIEDFALAKDRAAALKQLIPGTEDYYYYHALHALNTEQFERVEQYARPWLERFGQTPRYVEVQVFRALLESNAAFFAAQMTAMDAATRNSADMIEDLTLTMNKIRQAAITREIIEVVSGAQAL